MQIKTAVTLVTGAAVGFLFGLGTSEKTKEKIVSGIKGRIFYALTGEKMPEKKKKPIIKTNYAEYYKNMNEKTDSESGLRWGWDWDLIKKRLLYFDNQGDAYTEKNMLIAQAPYNGNCITVYELNFYSKHKTCIDYTWDSYGWNIDELKKATVKATDDGKWYYDLPKPTLLR